MSTRILSALVAKQGEIAAVELHAFDHFKLGLERLCFLDRDHAFVADPFHRVAMKRPPARRWPDSADLGDLPFG